MRDKKKDMPRAKNQVAVIQSDMGGSRKARHKGGNAPRQKLYNEKQVKLKELAKNESKRDQTFITTIKPLCHDLGSSWLPKEKSLVQFLLTEICVSLFSES